MKTFDTLSVHSGTFTDSHGAFDAAHLRDIHLCPTGTGTAHRLRVFA
jgi:hypothetical protein